MPIIEDPLCPAGQVRGWSSSSVEAFVEQNMPRPPEEEPPIEHEPADEDDDGN